MTTPPRDRHPPAEDLALVALSEKSWAPGSRPVDTWSGDGQALDAVDTEHVLGCPACLLTLSLMVRVARAARAGPARPTGPPASTWQEIRRRL
ncbi:hypothetical protein ACIRJS_23980 [Streptomyces sp. NPDC102340]|uniref:hypothetical protein n=1 Tax=unclassified Streptomyces TaxID=2593676 RepID=UPI003805C62C